MTTRNTSTSHALFKTAQRYFPGGVNSPVRSWRSVGGDPFVVERGDGAYLYDVDGNRYVDYICSWGPLVLGHAHPAVIEAITQQLKKGTSYGASAEIEILLAQEIQRHLPHLEMMRFVSSGTEATMHALRVARGFTGREKILKFDGCYHGASDPLLAKAGSGVATLGLPDSAGVPISVSQSTITAEYNNLDAVEEIFTRYGKEIAVVILEPVVGNSGFIPPAPQFLKGLRAITSQHGSLLLFDEVMTGFRIHMGGATAQFGVVPDLVTLGKVIGGGMPVGAYGGRREIMQCVAPLGSVYQAGTLSGNPVSMAAGLATLKEWSKPGVFERTTNIARDIVTTLKKEAASHDIPITADSLGTMFGFFFHQGPIRNYTEAKKSDTARFTRLFHALLNEGVYIAPSSFEAGFVSLAHEGAPLAQTKEAFTRAFASL